MIHSTLSPTAAQAFVAQLLAVQAAQDVCAKASVLCSGDDYEACHFALKDELVALWLRADALGLDLRKIGSALA